MFGAFRRALMCRAVAALGGAQANPNYTNHKGVAAAQSGATFPVTITNTSGNKLVAFQNTALAGGTSPAVPTGWTAATGSPRTISAGHELACYYRTADGSATYTFNNAGSGLSPSSTVAIMEFADNAVAPEAMQSATGSSSTADAGSVTPANTADLLVEAFGIGTNINGTLQVDASFEEPGYANLGDAGGRMSVGYKLPNSTSPVGSNTATLDSSQPWAAFMVVLTPG